VAFTRDDVVEAHPKSRPNRRHHEPAAPTTANQGGRCGARTHDPLLVRPHTSSDALTVRVSVFSPSFTERQTETHECTCRNGERDRVVANGRAEVLTHPAKGAVTNSERDRNVERVGTHEDDVEAVLQRAGGNR
jgi:hypothetical protein